MITNIILLIQLFFSVIIGLYFFNMLKNQQSGRSNIEKDSQLELQKLKRLKEIKLTEPLAERSRPKTLSDIIGQENGILALKSALCGPNPQHVIIYGPPGVGKTAAARVVLREAIKSEVSPFREGAKFVEIDATTLRFDERGIADPLIGSVHDPIYQGAGAYGPAGVPQPKPGAVTKAHGGILFIDEIGEMHPVEMNKLLKVLEDRKVFLESSYYSPTSREIPRHIHEIFQKGMPADFRLVGATTKNPEDIPQAIRSRCVEIFFRQLTKTEVAYIAKKASLKSYYNIDDSALSLVADYALNGRDAVNIVQIAGSVASLEKRYEIAKKDIEWVLEFGNYTKRYDKKVSDGGFIGLVNGLAVTGANQGMLMDIEVSAAPCEVGNGNLTVTGIVEKEEIGTSGQTLIRNSTARSSVENMCTVLKNLYNLDINKYNIHINFPGGMPIDGPSAGIAIISAVYSAITKIPISNQIAMTGEISIHGKVKPVGGVYAKLSAASKAGVKTAIIPKENDQKIFAGLGMHIMPVENISEVFSVLFKEKPDINTEHIASIPQISEVISAKS